MCSRDKNIVILAAAGSRKTEHVVESALAAERGRVLITTYTSENQRQIINRIEQKAGTVPPHIVILGWFSFLIQQCAKPYQRALTGEPLVINGLNFKGQRNQFARKAELRYFLDGGGDLYRDGVSDFVCQLNKLSGGAVIRRLERVFSHIFIDEIQDLVGYDLDVIDLLIESGVRLTMVGDPRQHTFSTNNGPRNKKYQGAGLIHWFRERSSVCPPELRNSNYRSNQAICDFADAIYPEFPTTTSVGVPTTGHDGVFQVQAKDLPAYISKHGPVTVLRHNKNSPTAGLPAMNIGVSKGSTFDRVVIFPTKPMRKYLEDGDCSKLEAPEKLYVAVTRARFSVAFVVPKPPASARIPVISVSD